MTSLLATLAFLSIGCRAQTAPLALPAARLQGLLQGFVKFGYGKAFHRLGEESDFDHGHVLLSAKTGKPVAILYHTQELASEPSPARNWLQWLDGRIEDARLYERKSYPKSASWDWFRYRQLPRLLERHTILDKMLDPALLGVEVSGSVQMTFTRVDCGATGRGDVIAVTTPDQARVCLALGS